MPESDLIAELKAVLERYAPISQRESPSPIPAVPETVIQPETVSQPDNVPCETSEKITFREGKYYGI